MKKKIFAIAFAAILAVTAITGASLAYLTDKEEAENVFTVGNVDIDLTEDKWNATGKEDAVDVYPGEPLAKDPAVENIGANPCFVRISVSNLDQFAEKYEGAMITYRTNYVDGALGDNWVLHTDGYFYYTKVLAVREKTDALFDQIVIPFALENSEKTKNIVVTAEAVQAQGARPSFTAVQAMTVEEIAAWFATCGM
jgi:predicted ribosomally synthesized peptide with SipW-like signal peptide